MKFNVTLDRDEDGVWIAECPSIPGCVSQGNTREEALENVKEAIQLCLEVRSEKGLPRPSKRGKLRLSFDAAVAAIEWQRGCADISD